MKYGKDVTNSFFYLETCLDCFFSRGHQCLWIFFWFFMKFKQQWNSSLMSYTFSMCLISNKNIIIIKRHSTSYCSDSRCLFEMRVKRTPSYVLFIFFILFYFSEFLIRYFVQTTTIDTKRVKKGIFFYFAQRLTGQKKALETRKGLGTSI